MTNENPTIMPLSDIMPTENPAGQETVSALREKIVQLVAENTHLHTQEKAAMCYIRQKLDQMLLVLGTVSLMPEELDDDTLLEFDPIGIVSESFSQVLENLRITNKNLEVANNEITAIINSVPAGILVMDSEYRLLAFNESISIQFQVDLNNVIGKTCNQALCKQDMPPDNCVVKRMLAGEINAANKNWPCRGKFYDVTATSIKDTEGNINRIVVLYNDITQRLQAEQDIRASEEQYRELFDNASDLIHVAAPDGHLRYVNHSWQDTLGYNNNEISSLSLFDLIHPECVGSCREQITKALQGDDVGKFETKFMAKDGRTVLLKGSMSCKFEAGIPVSIQGIFHDITEEQRLEEEIFKNQKLESIGVLAGGIAHDFNNLLTAILGNISLAEAETARDSVIAQRLGRAQKACAQAKHLTQQLLTFSKGGAPIIKTTSITELIRECASFTMRGSIIKCEYLLPDDLWSVQADEGQISQVLHNLLINGIQAMPAGGIICVRAENVSFAVSQLLLAPGRYVKITVTDQGTGIAPELLPRIFDPYFSTKEQGNGLGLAICHSIINKHKGLIEVDSEPGKGSSFHVYLPAAEDGPADNDKEVPGLAGSMRRSKILIMDDEELIRDVGSQMLTILGHEAHCAVDGEEAITLYRNARDSSAPFDLVIMDLTIPGGMGGQQAVIEILRIDPQARVIVSSGYSTDPVMANFRDYGFCGMITKPYSLNDLKEIVEAVVS